MAQRLNVVLNSIPSENRDLVEFIFFCAVGFTAGNLGLIWLIDFYRLLISSDLFFQTKVSKKDLFIKL